MKLFYDHLLVELDDVYAEIERLEIDWQEKKNLKKIVDETSHHHIINAILKHLDKEHHEGFLELLHLKPHDPTVLEWLRDKIEDVEDKIRAATAELKTKFVGELGQAKQGHKSSK